jgi:hypothetical protein
MTHMTTHLTEDDMVLHYYGEMDAAAEDAATAHLGSCGACQDAYTRLQRVMAAIDAAPACEPGEAFERTAWARLEPALPTRRGWLAWFVLSPARLAWATGVAVLVIAAFAAGRFGARPSAPGKQEATNAASVRERVLLVDLGEHLDRSQMVLIELVNEDPGDLANDQARAAQLLSENRLYRQAALKTGDKATAAVLDDLERVLVDVAASSGKMSQEDFDLVRRRIESQGLLFKVRVVSSAVREKLKGQGI